MPETFEDAAADAQDLATLNDRFRAAVRGFGFTAYAAGKLAPSDPPEPMLLVDWPQTWLELYAASGFAAEDVTVQECLRAPDPFTWCEIRARIPGASARIFAAAERYGWRDGFVVPIHDARGHRGIVNLATPRLGVEQATRVAVERVALVAYQHARRLIGRDAVPSPSLSKREAEALTLVARGYDDEAIAKALGISRATAHVHVERAKRRVGAATRAHAVALAIVQRLI